MSMFTLSSAHIHKTKKKELMHLMKTLISMLVLIFSLSTVAEVYSIRVEESDPDALINRIFSLVVDHNNQIDVNRVGKDGVTVLHLISESGAEHLVRLFVDRGADIDAIDHKGNTPLLHLSCNNMDLSQEQVMNMAIVLLENGADIGAQNNKNQTVVHCIVETHQEYLLSVFEEHDVDLSLRDDKGRSAESVLSAVL